MARPVWDEAPEFGRRETLLRTLRRLHELHPGAVCIVETGTVRNDTARGRDGDGWSTVAWGWYCSQVGGRIHTVWVSSIRTHPVEAAATEGPPRFSGKGARAIPLLLENAFHVLWSEGGQVLLEEG